MKEEIETDTSNKSEKPIQSTLQSVAGIENTVDLEDGEASTWSQHLTWIQRLKLSLGKSLKVFKSYLISSEDDNNFPCSSKNITSLQNSYFSSRFNNNDKGVTIFNRTSPATRTDNKINIVASSNRRHISNECLIGEINSGYYDEAQRTNISHQTESNLSSDIDDDNDSIVIAYLKDKDSFLDISVETMTTKNPSVLEKVPKMETIPEGEQFAAFQSASLSSKLSETSLDVHIPSFPGSPRSLNVGSEDSFLSIENHDPYFTEAVDFLHEDNDFLIAAETGNVKILEILLRKGANLKQMDHLGRNALHLAVCSDSEAAVILLLKTSIETNVKDNLGMTPLSLCLMRRPSYKIASLLFDHGAKIVPRFNPVDTGLFLQFVMMCTPTSEDARILKLLVEKGAMVNDPEAPGGRQALHFAAISNNCELIRILMDLGADLTVTNHRNETPKDVAEIFYCKEAYELLSNLEEECMTESNPSRANSIE